MGRKIRNYIIVISATCIIATAGIFVSQYNAYKNAVGLVERQFYDHQMLVAKLTSQKIEDNIELLIHELELLSKEPAVKRVDIEKSREIFYRFFKHVNPLYVNDIALLDSTGAARLPLMAPQLTGTDFSYRNYFKEARVLNNSKPTFEFIRFRGINEGERGIIVSMPLFTDAGEFNGVVLFSIEINKLISDLIPMQEESDYSITDTAGNILYHTSESPENISSKILGTDTYLIDSVDGQKMAGKYRADSLKLNRNISHPLNIIGHKYSFIISKSLRSVSGYIDHLSYHYAISTIISFITVSGISILIISLIGRWNIKLQKEVEMRSHAEERIGKSLEEKKVLLSEIHHRVKNNMAIIYALLNLQSKYAKDDNTEQILMDSRNRIKSMALIHEKLYLSDDFTNINFRGYIENLADYLLNAFGRKKDNINFSYSIQDINISIDKMNPCGLIINELLSNSLKHAFEGVDKPAVSISFSVEDGNAILVYNDNGIGLPEHIDFPDSSTLGLQIVQMLAIQLRGSVVTDRTTGTKFTINFRLDPQSQ